MTVTKASFRQCFAGVGSQRFETTDIHGRTGVQTGCLGLSPTIFLHGRRYTTTDSNVGSPQLISFQGEKQPLEI